MLISSLINLEHNRYDSLLLIYLLLPIHFVKKKKKKKDVSFFTESWHNFICKLKFNHWKWLIVCYVHYVNNQHQPEIELTLFTDLITKWTVSPFLIPCCSKVSSSLMIFPAKIMHSCSTGALNFLWISSFSCNRAR